MGNERDTPGGRRPRSTRELVRALEATLNAELGPEETDDSDCGSDSKLPDLTEAEKAFVAQFGQVEVVKELLGDQVDPENRPSRNRPD